MPYVGNPLANAFSSREKQDLTGQSGTSFTLTHSVSHANDLSVYINHVRQEPTTAYSVNGTTLTTTGSVAGTDDFYIIYDELAVQSISHPTDQALTATSGTFTSGLVGTTATFSGAVAGTTGTFSGDLTVDTNTLFVDASENKVGIGTTTVRNNLDFGVTSNNDHIIALRDNNTSRTILGLTNGYGVRVGSPHDGTNTENMFEVGEIAGDGTTYQNTHFAVTYGGNVGIGRGVPPNNYNGYQTLTIGGSDASTGSVIDMENSSGLINGQLNASSGRLHIAVDPTNNNGGSEIVFEVDGSARAKFDNSSNLQMLLGNVVIGTAGKGIDFSATANGAGANISEVLTDYEHGTWTPTAQGGQTISSVSSSFYQKIGQLVYVGSYFSMSAIPNNSGQFYFGGLPFAVATGSHYHAAGSITYVDTTDTQSIGMLAPTPYSGGGTTFYFHRNDGSSSTVQNSQVQGLNHLILGFWYYTTA